SLAMANAGPNTNGSQFFVVSGSSGVGLPPQYSLFGKVVKGLDVVAQMEAVDTDRSDRPRSDVVIESITITESD
ncbi:MAG TPA: peptidylprolyl isomerase, partial [Acidimicrobiales bacterium]